MSIQYSTVLAVTKSVTRFTHPFLSCNSDGLAALASSKYDWQTLTDFVMASIVLHLFPPTGMKCKINVASQSLF